MNKYISIFLILSIFFSTPLVFGEENISPILWKYKTSSWVLSTATTNDNSYTAASSLDGYIYFFDETGKLLWSQNVDHRVVFFSISDVVSAVTGERIYLFTKFGELFSSYKTVQGSYMVINQEGNYVGGSSSNVYAILYKNSRPEWDYRTGDKINSVSLTEDGSTLAIASSDNFVYVVKLGFLQWKYDLQAPATSVAVTPDASYIVCGSGSFESKEGDAPRDYKIFLFDKEGKLLWSQKIGYTVSSVSITPDGSFIAVGSWDKKVHIFSKSGEHLKEFKTEGNVWSVSITPDGKKVVAGSTDTNVYLLDVALMASPEKESSNNALFFIIPGTILLLVALFLVFKKKKNKK
ncbi:MAG: PQQ-binding-like beta-propeller repeat protein [Candidatus Methanofastidiosa archaeon]|nr:PQQ-binding-like beta-propeller repeat protein [Candidatus Methanofastidiosa archaeon]